MNKDKREDEKKKKNRNQGNVYSCNVRFICFLRSSVLTSRLLAKASSMAVATTSQYISYNLALVCADGGNSSVQPTKTTVVASIASGPANMLRTARTVPIALVFV